MKQLTNSERLDVAMSLLTDEQVDEYAERCAELERDCERNGFYDTPAECKGLDCADCGRDDDWRESIDCPEMD
uniref:Uncharacterized protein n=1 Tax=viral metagenome TaxID=1070528 RepID=A0A6M3LYP2_9ZZZZ